MLPCLQTTRTPKDTRILQGGLSGNDNDGLDISARYPPHHQINLAQGRITPIQPRECARDIQSPTNYRARSLHYMLDTRFLRGKVSHLRITYTRESMVRRFPLDPGCNNNPQEIVTHAAGVVLLQPPPLRFSYSLKHGRRCNMVGNYSVRHESVLLLSPRRATYREVCTPPILNVV
jgi:hypothetical protein